MASRYSRTFLSITVIRQVAMDTCAWKHYLCSLLCLTAALQAVHNQEPALYSGLLSSAASSPVSGSQPPTAAEVLASLTSGQLEALTPAQRLQLQQLMVMQQQQQLVQAQQLQEQIERQQHASLPSSPPSTSSPSPESPFLVQFTGLSLNQVLSKLPPSFLLSGANTPPQLALNFQDVSYSKLPSELSPFVPPPGAATIKPGSQGPRVVQLQGPTSQSQGLKLHGSAIAGGTLEAQATPPPPSMLQQLLQSRGWPQGETLVPLQSRQPYLAHNASLCPQRAQVCRGTYFSCTEDAHCSPGSKCCEDACGRVCKKATPPGSVLLPGILLVAQCISPHCGSASVLHNECDAVHTCRAPRICCFNGCRNVCRTPGQSGHEQLLGGSDLTQPALLMMVAAAAS